MLRAKCMPVRRMLAGEKSLYVHCQVAAVNYVSDKVSVVNKDIALLERGREVRYLGANLAIGDIFDSGMASLLSSSISQSSVK